MLKSAAIAALLLSACLQAGAQLPPANDYNLGYLLFNGLGGDKDPVRAVSLWQKASMKGQRESQWHLGYAYETGEGVTRDDIAAYVWYRCADASFRTVPPVDDADADMARDLTASVARMLARIPEARRRQADHLATSYIDSFTAGRSGD